MNARSDFVKLVLLLVPLIFILAIGIFAFQDKFELPFVQSALAEEKAKIQQLETTISKLSSDNAKSSGELAQLEKLRNDGVHEAPGRLEEIFRDRLEKSALRALVTIRSSGNMSRKDITDGVTVFEVSFSAECKIKGLYEFLDALSQEKPRLLIQNLTIKPNNAKDPTGVLLNGTLSILSFAPAESEGDGKE